MYVGIDFVLIFVVCGDDDGVFVFGWVYGQYVFDGFVDQFVVFDFFYYVCFVYVFEGLCVVF